MKTKQKIGWAFVGIVAYVATKKVASYVLNNTKFGQQVTEKFNELKEQAEAKINEARNAACDCNNVNAE